jgi:hypothetical protein
MGGGKGGGDGGGIGGGNGGGAGDGDAAQQMMKATAFEMACVPVVV